MTERLEDQPDTLAMIEAAFGNTRDILMNGTTNRYLSDHIEELIAARVAVAWQASRQQALEESALICDGLRDDAKEAETLAKYEDAQEAGDMHNELMRGKFWLTVSTFNSGLKNAAKAIRALSHPTGGKE